VPYRRAQNLFRDPTRRGPEGPLEELHDVAVADVRQPRPGPSLTGGGWGGGPASGGRKGCWLDQLLLTPILLTTFEIPSSSGGRWRREGPEKGWWLAPNSPLGSTPSPPGVGCLLGRPWPRLQQHLPPLNQPQHPLERDLWHGIEDRSTCLTVGC